MSPVKDLMKAVDRAMRKRETTEPGKRTWAIATAKDFELIEERILRDLVQGRLTYFALTVTDATGFSSCFFAPATKTKEGQGMIFVQDYGKIVRLLISHPKIRHVEYDPEEPAISAVFEDPYAEEDLEKADLYYEGAEEKRAREVWK